MCKKLDSTSFMDKSPTNDTFKKRCLDVFNNNLTTSIEQSMQLVGPDRIMLSSINVVTPLQWPGPEKMREAMSDLDREGVETIFAAYFPPYAESSGWFIDTLLETYGLKEGDYHFFLSATETSVWIVSNRVIVLLNDKEGELVPNELIEQH